MRDVHDFHPLASLDLDLLPVATALQGPTYPQALHRITRTMSAPSEASLSAHFQTLGLKYDASEAEIKRAYRKLAIKHHPDKNPDLDPALAAARFYPIQVAYDVLLDPAQRALASERARENAAREERMAAFSGKRKSAAEELEREERAVRDKRRREVSAREERETKMARLKEEGRRKVEEREAAIAIALASDTAAARSGAAPGQTAGAGRRDTNGAEALHTAGSVPTASERTAAAATSSSSAAPQRRPADPLNLGASQAAGSPSSTPGGKGKTPTFSFKSFSASSTAGSRGPSSAASGSAAPPRFSFNSSTSQAPRKEAA
ncbi:hypothetical protein V8E36_002170 [Tilletia maclaganii]